MMRKITLISAVFLLSACGGHSGAGHGDEAAAPPNSAQASANANTADVTFAQSMIPHHEQAIAMAALADTRASAGVKALAADVRSAQQPEINVMTGWLKSWGQPTEIHGGDHSGMPGMMSEEDMKDLEKASGAAFDELFLTMMIGHHEGAITMAEEEIAKGSNREVVGLAQRIVVDQQAEIATMKEMLGRA